MTPAVSPDALAEACRLLRSSDYTVAFTGAGISVPSGIPDFRSQGTGLWQRDDPMEVASLTAFQFRPKRFFNWLRPLAEDMLLARPNPAHYALAALEIAGLVKAVVTQNIDSLHQRAGARRVLELHGTAATFTCPQCGRQAPILEFYEEFIQDEKVPHCAQCRGVVKPDIVLFEESLPPEAWQQAEVECRKATLLLVVGSSLSVMPAAMLPMTAHQHGAKLVINNLSPTSMDDEADLLLPWDAAETLPLIAERLLEGA